MLVEKGHISIHSLSKDVTLKVENCVLVGIEPQRLLYETSKEANIDNLERNSGISPLNLFFDKFNCSKEGISLRDVGICPYNWFPDKFSSIKLLMLPIFVGISPIRLLQDKSNIVFAGNIYDTLYSIPLMSIVISHYNSSLFYTFSNPMSLSRCVGILPLNLLLDKSNTCNLVRFVMC